MQTKAFFGLQKRHLVFFAVFGILGVASIALISAAPPQQGVEAEQFALTGNLAVRTTNASTNSGGSYVEFGVNASPPSPPPDSNYAANLAKIKAQPWRNTNEDDSPYLNYTMQQLDADSTNQLNNNKLSYQDGGAFNEEWPTNWDPLTPNSALFRTACEFSHFAYDDPLVYPGVPERAHLHMFFGNTDVNAYTNYNSLFNTGGGTCNGNEMNRTGYWAPAVFDGQGNVRIPDVAVLYYKNEGYSAPEGAPGHRSVWARNRPADAWPVSAQDTWIKQTYPGVRMNNFQGVALIADHSGRSYSAPGPQYFQCFYENGTYSGNTTNGSISDLRCPSGRGGGMKSYFEMNIYFPMCWNGQNPWPYSSGNVVNPLNNDYYWRDCGAVGFNQYFSGILYRIRYEIEAGEDASTWYLSSDVDRNSLVRTMASGQSLHADWWGAWNPTVVELWNRNCQNQGSTTCAFGYMDGQPYTAANNGNTLRYREKYNPPGSAGRNKVPAQQVYNALCSHARPLQRTEQAAWCTAP